MEAPINTMNTMNLTRLKLVAEDPCNNEDLMFSVELRTKIQSHLGVTIQILSINNVLSFNCLCPICDQRFSHKSWLVSHMKTHSRGARGIADANTVASKAAVSEDSWRLVAERIVEDRIVVDTDHVKAVPTGHRSDRITGSKGECNVVETDATNVVRADATNVVRTEKSNTKAHSPAGVEGMTAYSGPNGEPLRVDDENDRDLVSKSDHQHAEADNDDDDSNSGGHHDDFTVTDDNGSLRGSTIVTSTMELDHDYLGNMKRQKDCCSVNGGVEGEDDDISRDSSSVSVPPNVNAQPCQVEYRETGDPNVIVVGVTGQPQQYKDTLQKHSTTQHNNAIRSQYYGKYRRPTCTICGKKLRSDQKYMEHMKAHTGEKPYVCTLCGREFKRRNWFEIHCKKHKDEPAEKQTSEREIHECPTCGKHFTSAANLKVHDGIHKDVKPFLCTVCGRQFRMKQGLKEHFRNHTGLKPYVCKVCGQSFTKSINMKKHEETHGDRVLCALCGETYSTQVTLENHIKTIHEGCPRVVCNVCGRSFKNQKGLKYHERLHTEEKKLPCSECGEKFNHRIDLLNHIRKHTGETPFKCSVCGRAFRIQSSLMRHLKTVHGETPVKTKGRTSSLRLQ